MIEYEATFSDVDKEEIRGKLKKANARLVRKEFLMKRVTFNLPSKERGKWLRVRDEGDKITMSYKAIEGDGIESQKEICLMVDSFDQAIEFLEATGCHKRAYQENRREIWMINEVEIVIDEWPFLEPFVEIEGSNENAVKEVAKKLGFDYSKAIFSSTDVQYSAKYHVSEDFVCNKVSRIAFGEKNPFLSSKK
jgi:adenylate cyclase class 2